MSSVVFVAPEGGWIVTERGPICGFFALLPPNDTVEAVVRNSAWVRRIVDITDKAERADAHWLRIVPANQPEEPEIA